MKFRLSFCFRTNRNVACLVFAVAIGLGATTIAGEKPTVKTLSVENPSHLLLVGNSYLYYSNSLHDHLLRMVIAAGLFERDDLGYKSVTINGARLTHHEVENYLKPGQLGIDQPFQVTVLQGHSTSSFTQENRALFESAVRKHAESIRQAGGEVALYLTPAYVSPNKKRRPGMLRDTESLYTKVGNEIGALVIPVGLAFEESYRRRPNLQLHRAYDGTHPSLLGTYLAAATVFAALYSQSPIGNPYDYFGAIDSETTLFLQQVAHDTVEKFYQLTD